MARLHHSARTPRSSNRAGAHTTEAPDDRSTAHALAPRVAPAAPPAARPLRILFLASAHNSLSQRVLVALTELGHRVVVEVVDSGAAIEAAVARHRPQLIVCPMLKTIIPDSVWRRHRCLVVHPGPPGDRGPSSLDWAIELGAAEWGVTVLEATGEIDGGAVWAARPSARARRTRAACTATRSGARRSRRSSRRSRRSPPAAARRRPAHRVTGRPAAAHAPARPGDRLGRRPDRHRRAPHPRGRGAPRRARHGRRHGVPPVRRPSRGRPARDARRDRRAAPRRRLPRDGRRRGVDQPPQAPRALQAARHAGARPRRPPARVPEAPLPATGERRSARSPTRSAPASATCASTSTTAR